VAALTHHVAFGIGSSGLSSFVPQSANLTALDQVSIDFSGETLESPAELSIDGTNLSPDSTYLVARVDRFDGVPYMVVALIKAHPRRVLRRPCWCYRISLPEAWQEAG
jgi:hypothetical protein